MCCFYGLIGYGEEGEAEAAGYTYASHYSTYIDTHTHIYIYIGEKKKKKKKKKKEEKEKKEKENYL